MRKFAGNNLTEYGIIFGLVVVVGLIAVKSLGVDIGALLGNKEVTTKGSAMDRMTVMDFGQGVEGDRNRNRNAGRGYSGSYYELVIDENGIPRFVASKANSTTSIATTDQGDGVSTDSLALAKRMDVLAKKYEEMGKPDLADKLRRMATLGYYLAIAEGELDAVNGLRINGEYTSSNALKDILNYKEQLKDMINSPFMAQLEPADRIKAAAYSGDTFNIAQKYANALGNFISPDGKVTANIQAGRGNCAGTCGSGDGTPGNIIAQAEAGTLREVEQGGVSRTSNVADGLLSLGYYDPAEGARAMTAAAMRNGTLPENEKVTITNSILVDMLGKL